ncbi:MAG: SDR family NAD(P)-dependent oxidoreductase [Tateyamaria sp.]|uniref:SDR family NAD(P)-dependent oxidoreductase n=1 Tax=Tateyamaria sp. TaxID=1929288 RepID=UPI0032A12620
MTKTILITGATDGIGRLTALQLAQQEHQVLVHGRSPDKLAEVAQEIGGDVETYMADLSVLSDVQALIERVLEEHTRLDILINNAGILKTAKTIAESGRDIRFDVNTLAPYALTLGLLPILPKEGRIINLSSAAQAPLDVSAVLAGTPLDHMSAYAQSKLAITIWTAELAREMPEGPSFIAVNPGSLLATKMVKEGFGIAGNDMQIGADILIRASLSGEFSGKSGQYFDNDTGSFALPHAAAQDRDHVAQVMQCIRDAL